MSSSRRRSRRRHPAVANPDLWSWTRRAVFDAAGWRCQAEGCGRASRLECDHRIPVSKGGDWWALSNLQALCKSCHFAKTRREFGRGQSPAVRAWDAFVKELR